MGSGGRCCGRRAAPVGDWAALTLGTAHRRVARLRVVHADEKGFRGRDVAMAERGALETWRGAQGAGQGADPRAEPQPGEIVVSVHAVGKVYRLYDRPQDRLERM